MPENIIKALTKPLSAKSCLTKSKNKLKKSKDQETKDMTLLFLVWQFAASVGPQSRRKPIRKFIPKPEVKSNIFTIAVLKN
ncbi:hypothetical protein A3H80_00550 [Candidatus Roizmanbacteria bacterium RIFCSPLOWO2_02_FULL_37_19]|uniref:Uncharacterized protein n=1 Tax=Candidatus Roizmanbacteria bacterium RIFCSPHIGHO2_02_FULL_37_24 TaxID=1802037 RepID=A0A1F7GXC3_9BACT|nr:MAG: hypothetical protein A2862_05030 [Candidatus Roizmanbacteria bacterium RIFCSPHIGHO2_01_FULL_38_41]OGK23737.1 MAG: hypothetical protein A3C24_04815 [Candidatus Roizmanbacteria bacterium RIFCSPHIGHO2_02_FULL_37_24]OGK32690.1 MAG: hypothetical protein A3E10_01730 [Candidatus Roizmanbacteria bacterium RIFCSPHIGHO2_12_FULL_37_23]OGK44744.1 MAG: hypothetical protein A2956_01420 [Candidatus Roizmanbacteria bacterium RIFCSPLOWO2_01_FULL_37_57]OGK54004.1 MAG: hypothetical protein A3H80_00550 [Ca